MAKTVTFDVEARQHLKKGIDTVAQAVRITLGPKGRNVVLEKKFGAPTVTNDGVTIVREIELKDAMENTGELVPLDIAVGDTVVYSKYGGTEITVEGEDLLILTSRDVLAKVTAEKGKKGK